MRRFLKFLSPMAVVTLAAALFLNSMGGDAPNGPHRQSSRAVRSEVLVAQRAPLPASDPRVDVQTIDTTGPRAEESCSHEAEGHHCGAPSPEDTREFVVQVQAEMAKLGIDASANPEFPSTPPGGPECGPVRTPTPAEIEQMQREFAETEKVLRELETQSPRDSQPDVTR